MKEVRWHARAGQGAKTVSQLLAEAGLLAGSSVQAFPEYGPERRGAPMRAYTRISEKAIRRHDPVTSPDIVIVLEPTLTNEMNVAEGLSDDGVVLVDTNELPESLKGVNARAIPATKIAHDHGLRFSNVVMLGAAAAAGGIPLEKIQDAATKKLGKRLDADSLRALYCPDSAILIEDTTFVGFDDYFCKGCEVCAAVCPVGAIEMVPEETETPERWVMRSDESAS